MIKQEIIKFINSNSREDLVHLYDKLYDKLKLLNRRADILAFYLVVVGLIYLTLSKTTLATIQIGVVTISDIGLIVKVIPVLFSYLILESILTSTHKTETYNAVKFIFLTLYKGNNGEDNIEDNRINPMARIALPFSYSTDVSRLYSSDLNLFSGCITTLLALPFLFLFFSPLYLEYYMLRDIFKNHFSDIVSKISFFVSIWIMILCVYYYLMSKLAQNSNKASKG